MPESRGVSWEEHDGGLIVVRKGKVSLGTEEVKIAAFDLDDTLIRTRKGSTHAKDADDWQFWNEHVIGSVRRAHDLGYQPIIFTNQHGLKLWPSKKIVFRKKITSILEDLSIDGILLYAATEKNHFRKPERGMWERMLRDLNVKINHNSSFFVGDAAGRPHNHADKQSADHSSADKDFAVNVGITFYTPNEFFRPQLPLDGMAGESDGAMSSGKVSVE